MSQASQAETRAVIKELKLILEETLAVIEGKEPQNGTADTARAA